MLFGGALFNNCHITDIHDRSLAGSLKTVQNAANKAIGSLIVDFKEIFDATSDSLLVDML